MSALTKTRAKEVLTQARMDIAMLMSRQLETQEEIYRLLSITEELYEGITGEEVEPIQFRARATA